MTVKITSPIEGYTDTSSFGPITLSFKDGVAEVDNVSDGLKAYLKARGYKVSAAKAAAEKSEKPGGRAASFDPAEHSVDEVNAYLADADDAERERVLTTEAGGKARATVKAPEGSDAS